MKESFPQTPVRLSIASTPAHLSVVRGALEKFCDLMGFDGRARDGIVLAVDEALSNVIRHAYHGAAERPIEVTFVPSADPPALRVTVRDWGDAVEPARIKSRDLDDVRPGGLGVHIMSSCMDEVRYERVSDGGTLLTMLKTLANRRSQ